MGYVYDSSASQMFLENKNNYYCVTSIYAEWHIGIALSSNFVASASSVVVTLCIPDSISKMACQI